MSKWNPGDHTLNKKQRLQKVNNKHANTLFFFKRNHRAAAADSAFWDQNVCWHNYVQREKHIHSQTPWEHIDLIQLFDPILHDCFGRWMYASCWRGRVHVDQKKNPLWKPWWLPNISYVYFFLALITAHTLIITLRGFTLSTLYNTTEKLWNVFSRMKKEC